MDFDDKPRIESSALTVLLYFLVVAVDAFCLFYESVEKIVRSGVG